MSTNLADATIAWDGGGAAAVAGARGSGSAFTLVVRSTRPFPPGMSATGVLTVEGSAKAFGLKVAGSRKVTEGVWEVRGRLLSATSDVLAAFTAEAARVAPAG